MAAWTSGYISSTSNLLAPCHQDSGRKLPLQTNSVVAALNLLVLAVLVQCPQARSVLSLLDEVLLNLPRGLPQDLPMEPLWLLELRMMTAIQIGPQLASLLLPWA